MLELIGALLTSAVGIAASPVPVIAAVLMMLSPSAGKTSVGFLAGWLLGITAAVLVTTLIAQLLPDTDPNESHPVRATIQVILGFLLLALSVKSFRERGAGDRMPPWMAAVDTLSWSRGLSVGFVLAVLNPKNLSMSAAAGLDIGALTNGLPSRVLAIGLFTLMAGSSVVIPIIAHLVAPRQMDAPLSGLKDWLVANSTAVMSVLFLLLGTSLVSKGLGGY